MPKLTWKNRIVDYKEMPVVELVANPNNWRVHPKAQSLALSGAIKEVGFVQNVIYNKRTKRLVDGHLRLELALNQQQETLPVTIVDLTEKEEALVLATLDPLGAMAKANHEILSELLDDVKTSDENLQALLEDMGEISAKALAGPAVKEGEDESLRAFTFKLDEDQAAEVDEIFKAKRDEAPKGVTDNEIFFSLITG